ncbi:MAG: flagellin [Planctomycetes bacterium]|nr:flagellin [Planctomycetota bacterium]
MSRINTNIQSLIARRVLNANNALVNRTLTRLSTGLRINTGKDDPAGLIISETLRSQKVAIQAATDNARRADTLLAIAEGGLQEINALLLELEDLVDRSASTGGLSNDETAANQLQIDSILQTITRLSNSTAFGGKKLLQGTLDFTTSSVATTNIDDVKVNSSKIADGAFQSVVVDVVTGSEFAFLSAHGLGTDSSGVLNSTLSASVTILVGGTFGTTSFTFASGTSTADMVTSVNASTQLTGISAITSANAGGATAVVFSSTAFGSNAFVSVEILGSGDGIQMVNAAGGDDTGVDGTMIINGQSATVDGLNASFRSGSLSLDLLLTQSFGTTDGGSTTFEITGGGAIFNIAPDIGLVGQETIGIQSMGAGSLGNRNLGFLTTLESGGGNALASSNFTAAQRIVRKAIDQVSSLRGRIGAFQKNTLGASINSLLVTLENTAAAESAIRDADFAVEVSNLTRAQILVSSSTAALQLANIQPQNVLALLG